MNRSASLLALLLLSAPLLLSACSQGGGTAEVLESAAGRDDVIPGARDGNIRVVHELPPPPETAGGAEQHIAPNDVIEVDLFQVDSLDRTVQVDSRGMIALALIGEAEAAGKTVRQLEVEIANRYGEQYLQSPQVTVFVKESFGQRVTVDGEVRKAGIYPTTSATSLIDIIAQAGGLTDIADASKIYVFRDMGGERLVANYDAAAIRSGKRADPRIFGGDVVVVFSSSARVAMRNLREVLGVARSATWFVP